MLNFHLSAFYKERIARGIFSLLVLFLLPLSIRGAVNINVVDSITFEVLPFATIHLEKPVEDVRITDENGYIKLGNARSGYKGRIVFAGYEDKPFHITTVDTVINIPISPVEVELAEVIIKPGKEKYSKKNNPAVDFMHLIREASKQQDPNEKEYYGYDKYEKTTIAINNFTGNFEEGVLTGKLKFLENYVDTSSWTGERLLDLIIKEKFSTVLSGTKTGDHKEIIKAYRSAGVDDALNNENMKVILEDAIREVDIFGNDINILQNRFVSPLSKIGPDFYKYYLSDTVYIGSEKCVELTFVPRNDKSMGFNGKIYVPVEDSIKYVKKITMRSPHNINLNFLRNLYINQSFEIDSTGTRRKTYDDVCVEMQIVEGTPEFYARKTTLYDNFEFSKNERFEEYYSKLGSDFYYPGAKGQTSEFWNEKRMVPLTAAEARLSDFTIQMRKVPILYWAEKFIGLMESGYLTTGNPSKFDIGPLNTLISYNTVEGVRLRLGGMTMSALNPHLFFRGYAAYGTRDHRWKYSGMLEYSFTRKEKHSYEWPRHGFYGSYTYDLDMIGQHYLFTNQDNIFLSLKRKDSDLVTYRKLAQGGYVLELRNNFSVEAGASWQQQESTPWLPFIFPDFRQIKKYNRGSFNVSLRWAKGERFVQGRSTRLPVNMDAWIFQLTHDFCPKGCFDSAYTYNRTEFSMQKRLWFSAFGYLDFIIKTGKVWSAVYFPDLLWQNANLSYTIQPESYSLLSPMEFANDSYASIDFTYFGNGVLFNRIPLINKLKLREAVTFKAFKGWLSNRNNPEFNSEILMFPSDCIAMKMGNTPYMEIGAGIDNIFSVLRVDYVWRLTYRDNPGVDRSGVRVSLHFTL